MSDDSNPLRYRPQIDSLRALSFLAVYFYHAFPNEFAAGSAGVFVFFALSGFLITGILRASESGRVGHDLGVFYARRSLRIFPLYYAVLLALWAMGTISDLPWYLAYLGNIKVFLDLRWPTVGYAHFWTLAVEEQFYLLWPLAFWMTAPRHRIKLIVCLLLVSKCARVYLSAHYDQPWSRIMTPCCAEYLLWGALLALLPTPRKPSGTVVLGAILFVVWTLVRVPGNYRGAILLQVMDGTPDGLGAALLVCGAWSLRGSVASVLSWRPLVFLGKISYGLYVYHMFALQWGSRLAYPTRYPWGQSWAICLMLTIAVASVSWYALERPILKLKQWLPYSPKANPDSEPGNANGTRKPFAWVDRKHVNGRLYNPMSRILGRRRNSKKSLS